MTANLDFAEKVNAAEGGQSDPNLSGAFFVPEQRQRRLRSVDHVVSVLTDAALKIFIGGGQQARQLKPRKCGSDTGGQRPVTRTF